MNANSAFTVKIDLVDLVVHGGQPKHKNLTNKISSGILGLILRRCYANDVKRE